MAIAKQVEIQTRGIRQAQAMLNPGLIRQAQLLQDRLKHTPAFPVISGPVLSALNTELYRWLRDWKVISTRLNPQILQLSQQVTAATRGLAPLLENFRKAAISFQPLFEELYRHETAVQASETAGWLPHRTTPFFALSASELTDAEASQILEVHYDEGWSVVRDDFVASLDGYAIDDLAKRAFLEALDNHEAGRFRSVVALTFNEIERVARVELYGGGPAGIASLHKVQDLAGQMELSAIAPGGGAGLRLFRRLVDHLYEPVKTAEDVSRFAADSVPNRHAATHGLIVYDSAQNSLNTLIMADYVFQVISIAKARADEGAQSADGA
jgi:hypothetical protein